MPDLTITLTVAQAARLATAFGNFWTLTDTQGLPRLATPTEIKIFLINHLKEIVRIAKRAVEEKKIVISSFDPT